MNTNIVERHYLHSSPITFIRNMPDSIDDWSFSKEGKILKIKESLESDLEKHRLREEKCYREAKVNNVKELTEKFFTFKDNNDPGKIAEKIILSQQMRDILEYGMDDKALWAELKKAISLKKNNKYRAQLEKEIGSELTNYFFAACDNAIESGLNSQIATILGINIKNDIISISSNIGIKKYQKAVTTYLNKVLDDKDNIYKKIKGAVEGSRGQLRSENSKYIKAIKKAIANRHRNIEKMIVQAVNYLATELVKTGTVSERDIKLATKLFEASLRKDAEKEKRLISGNASAISGELAEQVLIIQDIINTANEKGNEFRVIIEEKELTEEEFLSLSKDKLLKFSASTNSRYFLENGAERVDRFGKKLQSKVDTVFYPSGNKNGTPYYLSLKNSYQEIVQEALITNNLKELQGKFGVMLQGSTTSLITILNQLQSISYLAEEEKNDLIYVITNALINNTYKSISDRGTYTSSTSQVSFVNTINAVERILVGGINLFISDYTLKGSKNSNFYGVDKTIDFVLIANNWLVPVSTIIENILKIIDKISSEMTALESRVDFYLKGYSSTQFEELRVEKLKAVGGHFDKSQNYKDDNLVKVGSDAGNKAAQRNIKLEGAKLTIPIQNLVSYSY